MAVLVRDIDLILTIFLMVCMKINHKCKLVSWAISLNKHKILTMIMHGSLSCITLVFLLTLCRRYTDILSEERTFDSTGLDPLGNGIGKLPDTQAR